MGFAGESDSTKSKMKQCNWWSVACSGQYNWRDLGGVLVTVDGHDPSDVKVFRVTHHCRVGARISCVLSLANL